MKKNLLGLVICVLSFATYAQVQQQEDAILERIKPVAEVRVVKAGEAVQPLQMKTETAALVSNEPAEPLTGAALGEQIYQSRCSACHASGIAGAPKFADKAAWQGRIDQGMDVLVTHAVKGFKGMPAKGTCMTCSNDDIKAAVEFMVASCQN